MLKEDMTFADQVREAVKGFYGAEFGVLELADKMNLNKRQKKQAYNILHHMATRDDEAERVRPGVYRYTGRKRIPLEQVAWRILRARRVVTVPDLVELVGMKETYARQWLKSFEGQGVVKCIGGGGNFEGNKPKVWKLVHDPVAMPVNQDNREKHRLMRERRLEALKKIEAAEKALVEARKLLTDGGEE